MALFISAQAWLWLAQLSRLAVANTGGWLWLQWQSVWHQLTLKLALLLQYYLSLSVAGLCGWLSWLK